MTSFIHRPLYSSAVTIFIFAASTCFAQASSGIEAGVAQNTQQGTLTCSCGSHYSGGDGIGWEFNGFVQLPVSRNFSLGLKTGFDRKVIKSGIGERSIDTMVYNSGGRDTVIEIDDNVSYQVSESFFRFQPFIQNNIGNLFIQVGAGVAVLLSNNYSELRQLKYAPSNLTFTNGTTTETVGSGTLDDLNTWQLSAFGSIGYTFSFGAIGMAPEVTYEVPISNASSFSTTWKISSIYGGIAIIFAP